MDWNKVTSNLEKLPYYAFNLEKYTEKALVKPVPDESLFEFANELEGWFYAHIRGITKFAKNNKTLISVKAMETISAISKGFTKMWTKKVKQMQVPPFALNTKGAWVLRFDDIIADALELGALRTEEVQLTQSIEEKLKSIDLNGVPFDVVSDAICFCFANKREDTDWVHLPVANFDCYYSNTNFSKKWLSKIPDTILEREVASGICRVNLKI